MTLDELRKLVAQKEGLKLDFKREYKFHDPNQKVRRGQHDEFVKDVLALTNGNTGTAELPAHLVIGAGNELRPDGSRELFDACALESAVTSILDSLKSNWMVCRPPLPDFGCDIVELDGKGVIVITIPPSSHLHETACPLEVIDGKGKLTYYPENSVFIRRNEGTYLASEPERRAIAAEKGSRARQDIPTDAVESHRRALARKSRYARWGDRSQAEHYVHGAGVRLPLFASPYGDTVGESNDLSDLIKSHHRLLVLGEPGMGKTVALERITWEIATAPEMVVPVYVPLINYDGNLLDSVRVALNETGILQLEDDHDVEAFVSQYKCLFLFDGLNEVPGSRRENLQAELGKFLHMCSVHPCVITSRSQDNLWCRFHSREVVEDAVVVQHISDAQVREYLITHLGQQAGAELLDRLNEALRGLSHTPLLLWMIKEAALFGEELPGNRGQLFDRFIDQVLRREQKQPELVQVPPAVKKEALGYLAFVLQIEHRLVCDQQTAETIISSNSIQYADAIVRESLLNGLLVGDQKIHFLHQAVHEYFVGLRLKGIISAGIQDHNWLDVKLGLRTQQLQRDFRGWAKDDWWSESIVQLSGLVDDPDQLIRLVLPVNPWLAYWCAIEGNPVTIDAQKSIEAKTVARLKSSNVEERLRVVRELARMENPRTIKHLVLTLGDLDDKVVETATRTLARLGQPAVSPLQQALGDDHEGSRRAVTRTLGTIWQFAEIIKLGDDYPEVRRTAAETLGKLGDLHAVEPLVAALLDSDTEVRRLAADALGNLGDSRAAEPLLAALQRSFAQDVDAPIFKRTIAAALAKLGISAEGPLLLALHDTSDAVRQRAMVALGQVWHIPELSELVSESVQVRRDAAESLGWIGDTRVSEALVAALRDRDEQVRRNAIVSLGQIWQLPDLIALGDDSPPAREKAILALEKSADKRATQPLFAMLRDADLQVRRRAARALKVLGESDDVSLIAMLRDEDRKTRRDAALALAKIGGKLALDSLTIALHDEKRYVRETALEALAKLGTPAVEPLANALVSYDPELSLGAAQALRRIGTMEAFAVLHGYRERTH